MAAPGIAELRRPTLVLPAAIRANLELHPQGCDSHNRNPNGDHNHNPQDIAGAGESAITQFLSGGLDPIRVADHAVLDILGSGPYITELLKSPSLINNSF